MKKIAKTILSVILAMAFSFSSLITTANAGLTYMRDGNGNWVPVYTADSPSSGSSSSSSSSSASISFNGGRKIYVGDVVTADLSGNILRYVVTAPNGTRIVDANSNRSFTVQTAGTYSVSYTVQSSVARWTVNADGSSGYMYSTNDYTASFTVYNKNGSTSSSGSSSGSSSSSVSSNSSPSISLSEYVKFNGDREIYVGDVVKPNFSAINGDVKSYVVTAPDGTCVVDAHSPKKSMVFTPRTVGTYIVNFTVQSKTGILTSGDKLIIKGDGSVGFNYTYTFPINDYTAFFNVYNENEATTFSNASQSSDSSPSNNSFSPSISFNDGREIYVGDVVTPNFSLINGWLLEYVVKAPDGKSVVYTTGGKSFTFTPNTAGIYSVSYTVKSTTDELTKDTKNSNAYTYQTNDYTTSFVVRNKDGSTSASDISNSSQSSSSSKSTSYDIHPVRDGEVITSTNRIELGDSVYFRFDLRADVDKVYAKDQDGNVVLRTPVKKKVQLNNNSYELTSYFTPENTGEYTFFCIIKKDSDSSNRKETTQINLLQFTVYDAPEPAIEISNSTTLESSSSDDNSETTVKSLQRYQVKSSVSNAIPKYIKGYANGNFLPNSPITRAEAATIIARLIADEDEISSENNKSSFTDIDKGEWCYNYIAYLENLEFLPNYSYKFKPNKNITRGEFIKLVFEAGGFEHSSAQVNYTDLSKSHEYYDEIASASNAGIINGYNNYNGTTSINPDGTLTRAEAVTIINRILKISPTPNKSPTFSDLDDSHWAYGAIMAITSGK